MAYFCSGQKVDRSVCAQRWRECPWVVPVPLRRHRRAALLCCGGPGGAWGAEAAPSPPAISKHSRFHIPCLHKRQVEKWWRSSHRCLPRQVCDGLFGSANCSTQLADAQVSTKVTENGSTLKNWPFGMAVAINNLLLSSRSCTLQERASENSPVWPDFFFPPLVWMFKKKTLPLRAGRFLLTACRTGTFNQFSGLTWGCLLSFPP